MSFVPAFDARILLFLQETFRSPQLNAIWRFFSFLGESGWLPILTALVLLILRRTRKIGWYSCLSLALTSGTTFLIKNLVCRPRPYDTIPGLTPLVERLSDYSFPSGHTAAAFAVALILVRMLPKRYGIPAVVIAIGIAFSRLCVGVHYPTDVLAGFLLALLFSSLVLLFAKRKK